MQTEEELRRILRTQELRIQRIFELALNEYRDDLNLAQISRLIENGNVVGALGELEAVARATTAASQQAFIAAAQAATANIQSQASARIAFDIVNRRAVSLLEANQFRFIQNFTAQQTAATRLALVEGVREGLGPRALARAFRDSIGLTEHGERSVRNYRRLLERIGQDDVPTRAQREALTRQLRDRRSDSVINSALNNDRRLTQAQIDSQVERYRARAIKQRAETIARTEALASTHQGQDTAISEAIQNGNIEQGTAVSEWSTNIDGRERDWHHVLDGVQVPYGTPFENEKGLIMHPGDRNASAANIINCRCVRIIRIRSPQFVARLAA